jgi:hypothetical protein
MRQVKHEVGYGVVHIEEGEKAWVEVHGLGTGKVYYGESSWMDALRDAYDLFFQYQRADAGDQLKRLV